MRAERDDEVLETEDVDDVDEVDEVELRAGFGIVQCLPVEEGDDSDEGDEDEAPNGMATTVEAYLRQVRRQARAMPDVVTAKVSAPDHRAVEANVQTTNHGQDDIAYRKPSMTWMRSFLTRFSSLRAELQRIREGTNESPRPWYESKCLLALSDQSLIGLGQVRLHQLLEEEAEAIGLDGVTADRVRRVYEISALLDWPCHSDTLATMSKLVQTCSRRRSTPIRPVDSELALLNIVIAVCGGIFRQEKELAGIIVAADETTSTERTPNLVFSVPPSCTSEVPDRGTIR